MTRDYREITRFKYDMKLNMPTVPMNTTNTWALHFNFNDIPLMPNSYEKIK